MPITTDTTLTLRSLSVGVSKPLDAIYTDGDYTIEELIKFSWCSWSDKVVRCWTETTYDSTIPAAPMALLSYIQTHDGTSPAYYTPQYVDDRYQTKDFYCFNILLYNSTNASPRAITSSNASSYRLVTDIDITKIYCNCGTAAINTVNYKYPAVSTYQYADSMADGYYEVFEKATDLNVSGLIPACVLIGENDEIYITHGFMFPGMDYRDANDTAGTHYNNSFIDYSLAIPTGNLTSQQHFSVNNAKIYNYDKSKNILTWLDNGFSTQDLLNEPTNGTYNAFFPIDEHTYFALHQSSGSMSVSYCQSSIGIRDMDTLLTEMAFVGLYFKVNDTMYKPIIGGNNVVEGYSADLDEASQIDNITNVTGNTISPIPTPPTPPTPPPGPYNDDPWNGASFSGVGVGGAGAFAKCYYMTSTELANLRSWMNSNNVPEGFDPMQQIIGLSQVPVSLSGDDNTTVQFVNSSAVYDPGVTRVVDSGVNTQISMGTPKKYSLGSVDIVRRMQERGEPYLDYDCQIELYLPLIGMFALDTQAVMGRTITAEAVLDPISGTLAAYAYVSKDGQNLPIAYGSTTIGVDLPISAQQYSVSRAALKQANAQLGTSLLSSTLSLIAAATAGGKGSGTGVKTATGSTNGLAAAGIREAGADYMKASQAGNVFGDFMQWGRTIRQLSYGNNTAIAGSFGGSSAQWSYPFTPYVKINRPRYEKPSNYNHSQGVPCVQTKTVGSCTGFIQCIGVDVSGITGATDIELQAIQAALTNGVFAGGGS